MEKPGWYLTASGTTGSGTTGYQYSNGRHWQTRLAPNEVAARSLTYGVIGLLTSVLVIGAGFGIAAVETGYRARALARQSGSDIPTAPSSASLSVWPRLSSDWLSDWLVPVYSSGSSRNSQLILAGPLSSTRAATS
jgi:hypothetical protein